MAQPHERDEDATISRLLDLLRAAKVLAEGTAKQAVRQDGRQIVDAELPLTGNRHLLIEVKRLSTLRMPDVRSSLALGLVKLWAHVPEAPRLPSDAVLLVALVVPEVTHGAIQAARSFMTDYGRGAGWALVANSGSVVLNIPALDIAIEDHAHRLGAAGPRRSIHLFSDLNRWMLKVLALGNLPATLWGGPQGDIRSVRHLAETARVSLAAAQRFTRTFEEQGFLKADREGLRVIRRTELMRAWLAVEAGQPVPRFTARWIFGRARQLEDIVGTPERASKCVVGGFEAARRLGVMHALDGHAILHVARLEPSLEAFDLEVCEERDAQVIVIADRYPESVQRGAVTIGSLRVTDILQTAIDVCPDPARGREQTYHILRHVLDWDAA